MTREGLKMGRGFSRFSNAPQANGKDIKNRPQSKGKGGQTPPKAQSDPAAHAGLAWHRATPPPVFLVSARAQGFSNCQGPS